jgi:transcriptional regulator with XRE-family HTH domain
MTEEEEDRRSFAERLQYLMDKHGLTGYRLAKDLNKNNATVRNWLKQRAMAPREEGLQKVAKYFNVTPAWLRYGEGHLLEDLSDSDSLMQEVLSCKRELRQKKDAGPWWDL